MTDEEASFLRAIRADLKADAPRLIYADWLDDRGEPERAAFVRAEVEIAALASTDAARVPVERRLREAGRGLDGTWVAAVSRVPISGCDAYFAFRCPKRWESLAPTGRDTIRFCDTCRERVVFCTTVGEAIDHSLNGRCVALDMRIPGPVMLPGVRRREATHTVGVLMSIEDRPPPSQPPELRRRWWKRLFRQRPNS